MLKVAQLNALAALDFCRTLAPVFEHSPWIVARAESKRPFTDREDLDAALRETVMKATGEEKLALIRAHPDLVGRELLTRESKSEQATAGLAELSPQEIDQFRTYNAQYRERFAFPFVICARLNKKEAILDAFEVRLQNSKEQEMNTALQEIFKIAALRLRDLVE